MGLSLSQGMFRIQGAIAGKISAWRKKRGFDLIERKIKESQYSTGHPYKKVRAIVFMLDEHLPKGGLVDKLKGIVSTKALADYLGYDFKIFVKSRVSSLDQFLRLRNAKSYLKDSELSFNFREASPFFIYNYFPENFEKRLQMIKAYAQPHLYCNLNLLSFIFDNTTSKSKRWGDIFNEIFKFDSGILKMAEKIVHSPAIGIHLRFMNLLNDFTESGGSNDYLDDTEKKILLEKCMTAINQIVVENRGIKLLLVSSDSKTFLLAVQGNEVLKQRAIEIYADPTHVAHTGIENDVTVMGKAVLDFFLLSRCDRIFQVKSSRMHNSDFPKYASYITGKELTLVSI
jgi:hypothetical protein